MLNIMIIDEDRYFRKRFSEFLASCYGDRIHIRPVEKEELPFQKPDRIFSNYDLILCDELLQDAVVTDPSGIENGREKMVILAHTAGGSHREEEASILSEPDSRRFTDLRIEAAGRSLRLPAAGKPNRSGKPDTAAAETGAALPLQHVYKFQNAAAVIREIPLLSHALEYRRRRTDGRAKVIAVTGFSGGCGKTSFTMSCARVCSRMFGKNVLVLTTDRISDLYDFFERKNPAESSNINMLLLKFAGGNTIDPGKFLVRDAYGVSGFIPPSQGCSDLDDLSKEEFSKFLDFIEEWNIFDCILIDMNAEISDRNLEIYRRSSCRILLHDNRRQLYRAENLWYQELDEKLSPFDPIRVNTFLPSSGRSMDPYPGQEVGYPGEMEYCVYDDPDSFVAEDGKKEIRMTGRYMKSVVEFCRNVLLA